MHACMLSRLACPCPTLYDPMDSSPPGSSVHRTLQARILEWVATSYLGLKITVCMRSWGKFWTKRQKDKKVPKCHFWNAGSKKLGVGNKSGVLCMPFGTQQQQGAVQPPEPLLQSEPWTHFRPCPTSGSERGNLFSVLAAPLLQQEPQECLALISHQASSQFLLTEEE